VIGMLENETGVNRKMQLVQAYIIKENYNEANSVLNTLQQFPELANFNTLQNELIVLKKQHKTIYDIKKDSMAYNTIQEIAKDSLHAGYSNARTILMLIDDKRYPEVIKFNSTSQSYRLRKESVRFASGQQLLRNYPNPFNNLTIIEAQVDEKLIHPMLVIYDMVGKKVNSFNLQYGLNSLTIGAGIIKPGVYYYSIVSNDKRLATEKMICTQ
jgi:hypothetical protein